MSENASNLNTFHESEHGMMQHFESRELELLEKIEKSEYEYAALDHKFQGALAYIDSIETENANTLASHTKALELKNTSIAYFEEELKKNVDYLNTFQHNAEMKMVEYIDANRVLGEDMEIQSNRYKVLADKHKALKEESRIAMDKQLLEQQTTEKPRDDLLATIDRLQHDVINDFFDFN